MNYFDYMKDLKPDESLKDRTEARIKLEISKQNIKKSNNRKAYISIAACFILLVSSIMITKALTKNPEYIGNISKNSKKEFITAEKVPINMDSNTTKAIPQKFLIVDKLYLQYTENSSNNIEISKTDIGELICTITEKNLVDDMESPDLKAAGQNKFYNAEVYSLKNYKNNSVVLVKEKHKEEYYLFYLTNEQTETDN